MRIRRMNTSAAGAPERRLPTVSLQRTLSATAASSAPTEFTSVVHAVACAAAIQHTVACFIAG